MPVTVSALSITPVKAMRLQPVRSVRLTASGAAGNRRFYLIDADGRMVNGRPLGELQTIVACWQEESGVLSLTFPDGERVSGEVALGDTVHTRFFSSQRTGRLVDGPFSAALSRRLGRSLRLVATDTAVDRGERGAVSIISRGSLRRLAQAAGVPWIDARRFRMLIEVDGIEPHGEDEWIGRRVRIGEALVQGAGHVGRCMITTRDPDTGRVDLQTLHALRAYRHDLPSSEPLPFGIYGAVLSPGTVAVGDEVAVEDATSDDGR